MPQTLEPLNDYLQHLAHERNLSVLTRKNYARDIYLLASLAESIPLNLLQNGQIRRFVATLHGRGLSGKSIARALSAWRGFYDYLIQHQGYTHNPVLGLRAPKTQKTLPQALSIDQSMKLVSIAEEDLLSLRDHAILELFYSSGLRLSELVNLDINQLDFTEGTVTVTGKGNKTRIVPVGQWALEAIKKWLLSRASLAIPTKNAQALFVTKRGDRITPRAVQYRMKAWAIKQGVSSDVHPHLLRHSFASHVLQSSQDLRAVQEMLGHANISTTQVYTHLDFQHLAKIYDQAHPRAKK